MPKTTKTNGQHDPTATLKAAPISSLHKAVRLLGGTEQRRTSGHNYVLFRLPNGKHIQLPYQRKAGGNGETGRGHLKNLVDQITDAGIPTTFVTQALDHAGVTWHNPPQPNPTALNLLKSRTDLVKQGKWHTLQQLATPPQKGTTPPVADPTPPPAIHLPEKRVWSGLTLNEAIQLDLPNNPNTTTVNAITRAFSRMLANPLREPFKSLIDTGHVVIKTKKTASGPRQFKISETAASTLANEARARYETTHPHNHNTDTPPLEGDASKPTEVAPVALEAPEPKPEPAPTPKPAPATTAKPARSNQDDAPATQGDSLELNEAIGALIARYGVTPPLDKDLRLDIKAFIINLEKATREKA